MSQIVFFAVLTVLQITTTVWAKMSQNSLLHEFCAIVSQIVFLAALTVLRLIYNCMSKKVTKLLSPRVLCTNVINRFLTWYDGFTAYYCCMTKNVTKLISPLFCAQVSQIVLLADLTVFRLNKMYERKYNKTHISTTFVHKCDKSCS